MEFYTTNYPKYGIIFSSQNANNIYRNILLLYGSTLIPFTVYYNCSYNYLTIPNYFNSTKTIVISSSYQFQPTFSNPYYITFIITDNSSVSYSSTKSCVFNGYEVYNPKFNNIFGDIFNYSGPNYNYVYFYQQNIFTINDNYIKSLNILNEQFDLKYLDNFGCIETEIGEISFKNNFPSITVRYLQLNNTYLNGNVITTTIINNNICPIDLQSLFYNVYNIPIYGYNFNSSQAIIYPQQTITANYLYTNDSLYFCLGSFGYLTCSPIKNAPINYYVPVYIYNSQNLSTPAPFQQEIAICNGNINFGDSFAYVSNIQLYNLINPNGQNVLFFDPNNGQILYSWYEGQLNYSGISCYMWWVKLPKGIPAKGQVTIYMGIGNSSTNYYQLYYPYVGASYNVLGTFQYDNIGYVMNPGLMYQIYVNYSSYVWFYQNNWSQIYSLPLTPGTCRILEGWSCGWPPSSYPNCSGSPVSLQYCANYPPNMNGSLPSLGTTQNYMEVYWYYPCSGVSTYPNPPISNPSPAGVNESNY
ncbi:MAG: hypothetical protein ACP5G1_03320, partial [Nanopusillaceae archaeon]